MLRIENTFREQKGFVEKNLSVTQLLFDHAKATGKHFDSKYLPTELFTEQMDDEQIWQQLEMQNESFWEKCMTETCRLLSLSKIKFVMKINNSEDEALGSSIEEEIPKSNSNISPSTNDEGQDESSSEKSDEAGSHQSNSNEDSDSDENENSDSNENPVSNTLKNNGSLVDDTFFNLNEMEAYLDNEDKKELERLNGRSNGKDDFEEDSEEIDYFDSLSESESNDDEKTNGKDIMFADFFDKGKSAINEENQKKIRLRAEREAKNKRKDREMKEDLGIEDSEAGSNSDNSETDNEEKSEFDIRQQRLQKRIGELEEKAISEKPWQLKGEITSITRPKNSLLEEVLEFDSVSRPAPLITEETTLCLEDIIKRRIKSKVWDDVERKIKPLNDKQDFRKSLVLQQEKSKESLAQIYEKEYLEKVHKLTSLDETTKPDEPAAHTEIRKSIRDLFVKLDALSNFHFTSKPIIPESKIITNIPAIEMEEVAPLAVSDANLLAPEEIRTKSVGDEIGKTERTDTDKKRERRKKKQKQKLIKKQNDKRIEEKEKLGIKTTSKEKKQQLMKQVVKSRNVMKVQNFME